MSKLAVVAIAIGLLIVITSIIQIALEFSPRKPITVTIYQPVYVTVPMEREVVKSFITVTMEHPIHYTITVTEYLGSPSVVSIPTIATITTTITDTAYITETMFEIYTVTQHIIDIATTTVTKTITLANYAEHIEISAQLPLSPGSGVVFNPDNKSATVSTPSQRVEVISLLSLGVKSYNCTSCSLRIARLGDVEAVEITLNNQLATMEIHTLRTLHIDRGMLWLYIPGYSGGISVEAIHVKVGEVFIPISRDFYRYYISSSGVLVYIPLTGIPMIDGLRVTLSIWDWQSQRTADVVPMVSPSYRPISIAITPPTSVLNFMLKNNLCRREYYWGIARTLSVCRIEILAEAVVTSKLVEYREQNVIWISYYIDPEAYEKHRLISIVRIEPEPYLELYPVPLDEYGARYILRIVVKPYIY